MIGRDVGIDKFCGSGTGRDLVRQRHGRVVEEKDKVVLLGILRVGRTCAVGEAGDGLLFIVFVDFEIALREIVDVVPFFVGDDGVHENETRFLLDGGRNLHGPLRFGGWGSCCGR